MGWLKKIFDGRSAFRSADLSDMEFFVTDEQREKLQHVLVDIYIDIANVCSENNLTPFFMGGSALGAIRHKGFIPWDDDLDLGMMREEYERFIHAFEEKFSDKYIVSAPGRKATVSRFTKIIKRGTTFEGLFSSKNDELNGIFIDIFPIDNVPDNKLIKAYKGINADCLAYISSQVYSYCNRTLESKEALRRTGRMNYSIRTIIGKIFSIKSPDWWFERFDRCVQYSKQNTRYCTVAPGRKHYFGEVIEREKILPVHHAEFCGLDVALFNDIDAYLSNLFGNYMEIPPVEKRERHSIKKLEF